MGFISGFKGLTEFREKGALIFVIDLCVYVCNLEWQYNKRADAPRVL